MQAVTLLIKDALTRHRTAVPSLRRAFSHTNLRDNVSEDQIRHHFRDWCKKYKHDETYDSLEFRLFKKVYEAFVKSNADTNISDVYCIADDMLCTVGPDSMGPNDIPDSIDGRKKDQTSCGDDKGL